MNVLFNKKNCSVYDIKKFKNHISKENIKYIIYKYDENAKLLTGYAEFKSDKKIPDLEYSLILEPREAVFEYFQKDKFSEINFSEEIHDKFEYALKYGIRKLLQTFYFITLSDIEIIEKKMEYLEDKRLFKSQVIWLHGNNCREYIYKNFSDVYEKEFYLWQFYDKHKTIVIDYDKNPIPSIELIRLFEPLPYSLNTTKGIRQLLAENIIIISFNHPYLYIYHKNLMFKLIDKIVQI